MKENELHKRNIESGFTTPEGYFDAFENRLFAQMKQNATIPKEEGFKVPDGYFDDFENSLFDRLQEEKEDVKVIPLTRKPYLRYIAYAAAACVLFFGVINFFDANSGKETYEVTDADINQFIDNDLIAMNNYDIMEAFEEENIDVSTIFEVSLNETETIDYLENTIESTEDLIFE